MPSLPTGLDSLASLANVCIATGFDAPWHTCVEFLPCGVLREIEFNELDKFLRKRASTVPESAAKKGWGKAAAAAGAKKVLTAKKPLTGIAAVVSKIAANATGLVPAADDLEGDGKEDFYSRMKKRANDYFAADADGDSKLDFDEFVAMVAQRDDAKDFKQDQLRTLFDALDIDKSGKLDLNEYIQWALRESLGKSRGKVIDLFRACTRQHLRLNIASLLHTDCSRSWEQPSANARPDAQLSTLTSQLALCPRRCARSSLVCRG